MEVYIESKNICFKMLVIKMKPVGGKEDRDLNLILVGRERPRRYEKRKGSKHSELASLYERIIIQARQLRSC